MYFTPEISTMINRRKITRQTDKLILYSCTCSYAGGHTLPVIVSLTFYYIGWIVKIWRPVFVNSVNQYRFFFRYIQLHVDINNKSIAFNGQEISFVSSSLYACDLADVLNVKQQYMFVYHLLVIDWIIFLYSDGHSICPNGGVCKLTFVYRTSIVIVLICKIHFVH